MLLELRSLRLLPHIQCSGSCFRRRMRGVSQPATVCELVSADVSELMFRNTMACRTCTPSHHTRALLYALHVLLAGRAVQAWQQGFAYLTHRPIRDRLAASRGDWIGRGKD